MSNADDGPYAVAVALGVDPGPGITTKPVALHDSPVAVLPLRSIATSLDTISIDDEQEEIPVTSQPEKQEELPLPNEWIGWKKKKLAGFLLTKLEYEDLVEWVDRMIEIGRELNEEEGPADPAFVLLWQRAFYLAAKEYRHAHH